MLTLKLTRTDQTVFAFYAVFPFMFARVLNTIAPIFPYKEILGGSRLFA